MITSNGDGTFNYDPLSIFASLTVGDTATDSFTYTVTDGNGGASSAQVTLSIKGTFSVADYNTAPVISGVSDLLILGQGDAPVVIDAGFTVVDAELDLVGNYGGAVFQLEVGEGSADDQFAHSGTLEPMVEGGSLIVDGQTIGTVEKNSAGILKLSL